MQKCYVAATLVGILIIHLLYKHVPRQMTSFEWEENLQTQRQKLISQKSTNSGSISGSADVDITMVTMYLNLGKFRKGDSKENIRDKNTYLRFMNTWAWLNNTVYAFFDDKNILGRFQKLRENQPPERTKIYLILSRKDLPAFKNLDKVTEIFAQPGYPKYYPNTVNPEYSLAMNAKFDSVGRVLEIGDLTTKYIAWLDIGAFRQLLRKQEVKELGSKYTFKLEVPPGFNDSTVSYSKIKFERGTLGIGSKHRRPLFIIKNNLVWVGGAYFLATKDVMRRHVADYRSAVSELLSRNLASTDQQVVASLYFGEMTTRPTVDITPVTCDGEASQWYCLAYLCKNAAAKRKKETKLKRKE